jgi:molybdenum cofactor cytidylyltransferase
VTNTPPLTVERTVGVILAAGQGSRFSGPTHKLTAPFRGRAVVSWTIEAAINAGFDQVLVVTGNEPLGDVISATGAVEVHNERWATGQGSSLAAAIGFVTQHLEDIRSDTPTGGSQKPRSSTTESSAPRRVDAIVVGLGDQPLVTTEAWRRVGRCTSSPIVVATYVGTRRQPVRLAREVWPLLNLTGDEGARSLVALRPDLVTELPCEGNPVDIDTVEDLARWNL